MQILEKWYPFLVAILLVCVAVMVFAEYGEDGAVLFDENAIFPAMMALMFIVYVISQTMRDKNLIASFERLSNYMASNPMIMNELSRRYQNLPNLPKQAADIVLDVADAVADLTDSPDDNEFIDRLRAALDSKEKSLEPTSDAMTVK
jgi:hypothetical protein